MCFAGEGRLRRLGVWWRMGVWVSLRNFNRMLAITDETVQIFLGNDVHFSQSKARQSHHFIFDGSLIVSPATMNTPRPR